MIGLIKDQARSLAIATKKKYRGDDRLAEAVWRCYDALPRRAVEAAHAALDVVDIILTIGLPGSPGLETTKAWWELASRLTGYVARELRHEYEKQLPVETAVARGELWAAFKAAREYDYTQVEQRVANAMLARPRGAHLDDHGLTWLTCRLRVWGERL